LKPDAAFLPLTLRPPIIDTIWGAGAAVLVFRAICRDEPLEKYRSIAIKALAVSFLPDVWLAFQQGSGGGWPAASALAAMHVAVWAICVTLLPVSSPVPVVRDISRVPIVSRKAGQASRGAGRFRERTGFRCTIPEVVAAAAKTEAPMVRNSPSQSMVPGSALDTVMTALLSLWGSVDLVQENAFVVDPGPPSRRLQNGR
jgi:hypothetical protein